MAPRSEPFTWQLYGGKKPCFHCGGDLKKEEPGGLWIAEFPPPLRISHFRCEFEALRESRLTPAPRILEGQQELPV